MRVYHWVAILFVGALLTASAASVMLGSQKSDEPDAVRVAAVKNGSSPALIRESQVRRAPSSAPKSSAPQRVETIKFDSWIVTCRDTVGGTAKKTCGASLKAMSQDRRELLLNWELGLNKDGHFITAIYVPPFLAIKKGDQSVGGPLLIQNGVELKFGNGPARRISYLWCGPKQCLAEALIDDAFVKDALANTMATITVHTAGGGSVPIEIPITGIDKAISLTRK
jgi:invasion protein IalB